VKSVKSLLLAALAAALLVLPATAQTPSRGRTTDSPASVTEVSQNTAGITTKTTAANPDISIPSKVAPAQKALGTFGGSGVDN
jgi:hypothetical protein